MSASISSSSLSRSSARVATGTWLWLANGVFWFVLAITIWGAWMLGPDFRENSIGREVASAGYVRWIRSVELLSVVLFVWQVWYFIVRPKLQTGSISIDGLFFCACGMLYLQEPWLNYNNHQFLYTTVSFNRGSWCGYVPGWNSPNPELIPVGSPIWATAYFTLVGLWVFCGAKFMAWWKSRHPGITPLELILVTFLVFIPFDFVLEYGILTTELFNYASTVPELTLWAGQKNQFPLYETVSWCACLTAWSAVRHFQNDRGETLPERGLSRIRFPTEGMRTFTRFLVITGFCQLLFLLLYDIPYFYWSTKGAAFPDYAPYRIGGLCGPGTNFDCPGLEVPVPKKMSPTNRTVPVESLPLPVEARE